ncbi:CMP-N,N'-diacetyllegionaminic acid synthase [subsurface metagenome]
MEKYEIVSFIPARGGSKRIPKKNIKMLAGKPMINWTIEASLKSKYIDRTFVSTEDKEIKEIALKAGAEVIDRPEEFTVDGTMAMVMSINQFMYHLWKEDYQPDIYIHLYPTNPLRTTIHIDEAIELHRESKEDFLCSVCLSPDDVQAARYINNKTGLLEYYYNFTKFRDPSQYTKIYRYNGAIAIGHFPLCVSTYLHNHVKPYIMTRQDAIDVDTPFDLKIAEMLLEERIKGRGKND